MSMAHRLAQFVAEQESLGRDDSYEIWGGSERPENVVTLGDLRMAVKTDLPTLQREIWEWRQRQPWAKESPTMTTLGLAEEVGEVCRASLKMAQGIRGTDDEWLDEIHKELGDVFIKVCDVASVYGLDVETIITERWGNIKQRNFTKDRIGHGIASD